MNFVSIAFFVFFAVVLLSQVVVRQTKARQLILLTASYFFYGWWDWRFCFLMLLVTIIAHISARRIAAGKDRKVWLAVGVAAPLVVLFFFKYFNFFVDSFATAFGIQSMGALAIILPVGISFYTFQSMSYTIDVYRERIQACPEFYKFALYVSFFPQLVAGPIVKASEFMYQLEEDRHPTKQGVADGVVIFFWGMFKKAVLADNLSVFVDAVFATPGAYDTPTIALAVLSYALQIYFDFSGYSDMAIGSAKCLGYDLPKNFDLPYISANVSELWKRWHISLSTWLQQYLYFSLGGNRKGKARTYFNLMATMVLGGLWHGANWTFVVWGALHGLALCVHKGWRSWRTSQREGVAVVADDSKLQRSLVRALSILGTFLFVCLCWVFFRAESIDVAFTILQRLAFWSDGVHQVYTWTIFALIVHALSIAWCALRHRDEKGAIHAEPPALDLKAFKGVFLFTLLVGFTFILMYTGESPFIYFQF